MYTEELWQRQLIKELEQQEKDLINKKFSPEMVRRQQDILTRLLESEKALKERGFQEKREAETGKDKNYGNLFGLMSTIVKSLDK